MASNWQFPDRIPKDGKRWGKWHFDKKSLELVYGHDRYRIDLKRIEDSAGMLDWIFQMTTKSYCTSRDLGDLVKAFDDLFYPQANLCSNGINEKINPTK